MGLMFIISCSHSIYKNKVVSNYSEIQKVFDNRNKSIFSTAYKFKFDLESNLFNGHKLSMNSYIDDSIFNSTIFSSTLGIPVGQLYYSNDTLLFINRIEKNYYILPISNYLPASISFLETIRTLFFNSLYPELKLDSTNTFFLDNIVIVNGLIDSVSNSMFIYNIDPLYKVLKVDFKSYSSSHFFTVNYSFNSNQIISAFSIDNNYNVTLFCNQFKKVKPEVITCKIPSYFECKSNE